MADKLIDPVKKYDELLRAIPKLREMLDDGSFFYMGGSLFVTLDNGKQAHFEVRPLSDYADKEAQEAMYLISRIYMMHKTPTHSFYTLAKDNVETYEGGINDAS